jgi:uncharacterized protein (UPF0333 family)
MFDKNKKGQAAMEFLMTYGWAILAAVIVVGVLWYMIGNPANLIGNDFRVGTPFVSEGVAVATNLITLEVRNGAGESVTITDTAISGSEANCTTLATDYTITAGSTQQLAVVCVLASGARINGDVTISYTKGSSTLVQAATGSVSGKAP